MNVLSKIVRTWPNLILFGAVRCSAHIRFTAMDCMNTLLVSIQVIFRGETLRPVAAWYIALEWFLVAKFVFAGPCQSLIVDTHFQAELT